MISASLSPAEEKVIVRYSPCSNCRLTPILNGPNHLEKVVKAHITDITTADDPADADGDVSPSSSSFHFAFWFLPPITALPELNLVGHIALCTQRP